MPPDEDTGRIPKQAFLVSTALLFALSFLSVCARFFVRLGVQKEFTLDDGFLAFGTCCLTAALIIIYIELDDMYLAETVTFMTTTTFTLKFSDLDRIFKYRKMVTACLMLSWVAVVSVKFSFLALFRRLIDRIPALVKYWWFVVAYNVAVSVYGAVTYIVACPQFSGFKSVSCVSGDTKRRAIRYSLSALVLDVVSDFMILYIPCQLIWKVKIKLIQKVTLACSLCLTAIVIVFSITQTSGLVWRGNLDALWEVYFHILVAEVGLILTSMTAFRALFVSRSTSRPKNSPHKTPSFLEKSMKKIRKMLDPRLWTTRHSKEITLVKKPETVDSEFGLPSIPGGTMTGMRTFIDRQGQAEELDIGHVGYPTKVDTSNNAEWPLPMH